MCRIAGIISNTLLPDELMLRTRTMCGVLAHGGPDDEGFYRPATAGLVFGHRRLAIIDLSINGHQPMADTEQKVWITFNGEIYNYLQLKEQLTAAGAIFNSDTDTEVIIQAYRYWGLNSFARLRGMFAFALYDAVTGATYLVRDTAGIKPLYYHINGDQLSFASEVKALKDAGIAVDPDPEWPVRFLAYGHIPEPYTTQKGVLSIAKGHYLKWDHQSSMHQISSYQAADKTSGQVSDLAAARTSVRDTLDRTIQRQLLADAPIGVFLSGGIDSSIVTLLAHRYKKTNLKTVSIFFDEQAYNEREYQDIIVKNTGTINYQHLVKRQDLEEALPHIINDMDMPTTDGINSWFISKYAHQDGLKAVLSGLGADELFGGYPSFNRVRYLKYLKLIPSPILLLVAKLSTGPYKRLEWLTYDHPLAEYFFLRGMFVPAEITKILGGTKQQVASILFSSPMQLQELSDKEKASWFETNLYMQNQLLRDTDVMSMAHGLEVRVPFLDEDLVSTVNNIAPDTRFDEDRAKSLLIDSCTDILPKEIWDRPKMGFSFPLQQWLLEHKDISSVEHYKGKHARKVIKRFRNNDEHWSKAFALYQLQAHNIVQQTARSKKILLLTLQTFSATGGIQKMGRTMAWALQQIADARRWSFSLWSGYDSGTDLAGNYTRATNFKGFNKNRVLFALDATLKGLQSDVLVLSHINLAMVGLLVKIFNPKCKVWLVAHGIEVWRPLNFIKRALLKRCDKVICVSNFTRKKVIAMHQANAEKCIVLNNALDPSIRLPANFEKPGYLLERYGLSANNKVIFTLTRLASTEQYKGYEQVIKAVSDLKEQFHGIKYILSGKYDDAEDKRIRQLINDHGVTDQVIVTGFINETELEDHFLLADLFVLPSKKEGFGIVFIEALACGLPVICGNEDGSLDAIRNGELGKAINVDNLTELEEAITGYLNVPLTADDRYILQSKCLAYFNSANYKEALETMLI